LCGAYLCLFSGFNQTAGFESGPEVQNDGNGWVSTVI
jgi:hypothetical protein